jgi:hemerythrin-like domain-containing protein
METLERQHREAAGMHATIGHLFEAWMANGALAPRDAVGLRSTIQRLLGLYTEHIRTEETLVFPHARRSLDAAAIAAIGPEFQLRRK